MRRVFLIGMVLVMARAAVGQVEPRATAPETGNDVNAAFGKCPARGCELDLTGAVIDCSRTDGGSCFPAGNGVWLRGSAGTVFRATNANISSILSNSDRSGRQEYWFASGIALTSRNSHISGAALDLQSVFVNSYLRDSVILSNANTWAARFQNNGATHQGFGPFLSENNWYTGQRAAGSEGLLINDQKGGGNFADFTSIGDTFENFDSSSTGVAIESNSGQLSNLYFLQPHWESGNNIGFDLGAVRNVTIDSPLFAGCCGAQAAIRIRPGAANIWVRNLQSSWRYAIVDQINGRSVAAGVSGPALVAQYAIGPPEIAGWNTRGFIFAGNPGGELEIMHPGAEELRMSGTGGAGERMEQIFYQTGDASPAFGLRNDGIILEGQGGASAPEFCIGERHGVPGNWGISDGSCRKSYFLVRNSGVNVVTPLRVGDGGSASATLDVAGSARVSGSVTLPSLAGAQVLGTDASGKLVRGAATGSSHHVFMVSGQRSSYNMGDWYTFASTGSPPTGVWRLMASVYQDGAAECHSYGSVDVSLKWHDARGEEQTTTASVTFSPAPAGGFPAATPGGTGLMALSSATSIQVRVQYRPGSGCTGGGSTYTAIADAEQVQ